ncbi:hypothetical protein ABW20_dc0108007 [Dactylellina cionopaga]|nr:hypothetical protein ABW20_dc0108007 [Dactylellina cionopaga]
MDGLSAAASIIAVIQVAASVAKYCGKYITEVKSAKKDIQDVKNQVEIFLKLLESTQKVIEGPYKEKFNTSQELIQILSICMTELGNLNSELENDFSIQLEDMGSLKGRFMRNLRIRQLKWPLKKEKTGSIIKKLDRLQENIKHAIQIDHIGLTLNANEKVNLEKILVAKGATFDSFKDRQEPECHPGTREELLKEIAKWVADPCGKPKFWLRGMAGTGKSTISKTVARTFQKNNQLVASFFFKRGEADRGNASKFFTTIADNMMLYFPQMRAGVSKAVEADAGISTRSVREQFQKLIFEPLSLLDATVFTAAVIYSPVVIVVDALDECEAESGSGTQPGVDIALILELFSKLQNLFTEKGKGMRVFLTSRPETPINHCFKKLERSGEEYQDLALHDIEETLINHDIFTFLKAKFEEIQKDRELLSDWPEDEDLRTGWPGDDAIRSLTGITSPLFIAATTASRYIADKSFPAQERLEILLKYQSLGPTSDIDRIYLPIFRQLLAGKDAKSRAVIIGEFQEIVGTIVMLESPLSREALSRFIVFKADKGSKLTEFLDDIKRFAQFYQQIIDRAPLQLYYSALLFAPESSIIKRLFSGTYLKWIQRASAAQPCWSALMQTLEGHNEGVASVAFSPDGKRLASGSPDGSIKIWDPISGDLLLTIDFNPQLTSARYLPLGSLNFSPNSKQLASASLDDTIRLWDPVSGDLVMSLKDPDGELHDLAFSPDGKRLVSASLSDTCVKLWDLGSSNPLQILGCHDRSVTSVAFSPDGKWLASGSYGNAVKIWDLVSGHLLKDLQSDILDDTNLWRSQVAFSPNGKLLLSCNFDSNFTGWQATRIGIRGQDY